MRQLLTRFRVILISLSFIFFVTGFLIFPRGIAVLALELDDQEVGIRILLALLAVFVDATLIYIIYQEVRTPIRQYGNESLPVNARGSDVAVSMESVKQNLETQLLNIDEIIAVQTTVKSIKGRVAIEMQIDARDTVNIKRKTTQVKREIRKVVVHQLGLRLYATPSLRFDLKRHASPSDDATPSLPDTAAPPDNEIVQKSTRGYFRRETDDTTPPQPAVAPDAPPVAPAPKMDDENDNDTLPLVDDSSQSDPS